MIRRIDLEEKEEVKRFIQLPLKLYRDNPYWIPTMRPQMRRALDPSHPFYSHSEAAFLIAEGGGECLGRLAVLNNRRFNKHHNRSTAFFYFFEAVDFRTTKALFQTAFRWARKRGLTEMVGPKGLLQTDGTGMLVKGFKKKPALGIPYNPACYPDFLEWLGFERMLEFDSGVATLEQNFRVPDRFLRIGKKVKRRGLRVLSFSHKNEMRRWIPKVRYLYNRAFQKKELYYPINEEEMEIIGARFSALADPRLIKIALKGKKVVGFLLAYPDIREGIKKTEGRLWPFGWFRLWQEKRRTRVLDVNGVGVLPEHQGGGGTILMYLEMANILRDFHFRQMEIVQIAESNRQSRAEAELLKEIEGVELNFCKRHCLYQRRL